MLIPRWLFLVGLLLAACAWAALLTVLIVHL